MIGKMTVLTAVLAVLATASFAGAAPSKKAKGVPNCCATHTRCCNKVKYCCDQPDKAECCKKQTSCCNMAECCGTGAKKASHKSHKK